MSKILDKNTMFGLKSFQLQTIEHEASHPKKTYINFVPFARFCEPGTEFSHPQLNKSAALLEWIYGYRNQKHSTNRNKRRAPSAGGLYPNEVVVLTYVETSWKLLYYSFEKHLFFLIRELKESEVPENTLSNKNKIQFFFISVLWKTVQKYGVRGFRYSLLDAGFIASHLQYIYKTIAPDETIELIIGNQPVQELIPLKKAEELMFSISITSNFKIEQPVQITDLLQTGDNYSSGDTVPCLSTNMIRIIDISEKALKHPATRINLNRIVFSTSQDCFTNIEKRLSANGFKNQCVETSCLKKIKEDFFAHSAQVAKAFGIHIHLACIINQTTNQSNAVELYSSEGSNYATIDTIDIGQQLQDACQKQIIMTNAAFTFVLFVLPEEVNEWSYFKYAKSILASSFICSALYFSAMKHQIGTTTIGGFSEKKLMELLKQKNILPIVVQAFGIANTNQLKIDALITQ